jgi:hypothetical protein
LVLLEYPTYGLELSDIPALCRLVNNISQSCKGVIVIGGDDLLVCPDGKLIPKTTDTELSADTDLRIAENIRKRPINFIPYKSYESFQWELSSEDSTNQECDFNHPILFDVAHEILETNVNHKPLITNLSIYSSLTELYSQLTAAKVYGVEKKQLSFFSKNSLKCEECDGSGWLQERAILTVCPICNGTRFQHSVRQLVFRGIPFSALFNLTPLELLKPFSKISKIYHPLHALTKIGLSHLKLGIERNKLPLDTLAKIAALETILTTKPNRNLLVSGLVGICSMEEISKIIVELEIFAIKKNIRVILN